MGEGPDPHSSLLPDAYGTHRKSEWDPEGRTKWYHMLQSHALLTRPHYDDFKLGLINDDADVGSLVERETWTTHDLTHDGPQSAAKNCFLFVGRSEFGSTKKTSCKAERAK